MHAIALIFFVCISLLLIVGAWQHSKVFRDAVFATFGVFTAVWLLLGVLNMFGLVH